MAGSSPAYTTYQSGAALQPGLNGNLQCCLRRRLDHAHNALPDLTRPRNQIAERVGGNEC